jgi:NAD(P)-dependent dehydrogenase (short-subunit alcohol dehydrogenase family)
MARLDGKRVLITGGTTGIGFATAKLFLEEGAEVAITGQNAERVDEAGRTLGNRTIAIRADVTRRADMDAAVAQVVEAWGGIDVVFANAGIAPGQPVGAIAEDHVSSLLDVNVRGVINTLEAALPHLQSGASVIITGSVAAQKALPGQAVYAASKAAVRSLARSYSAALAARGIRVNVMSPGPTETPIFDKIGFPAETREQVKAEFVKMVPAGRFADPREMAEAALYLASDHSVYVVGADLLIDGGVGAL